MDKRVYEFIDGWAAYFQSKRGWNLAKAKVWVAFSTLVLGLAQANTNTYGREVLLLFIGLCFGLGLWTEVNNFKVNGDYPESVRKCEHLNAFAVVIRERMRPFRTFGLFFLGVIWLLNIPFFVAKLDIGSLIVLVWYPMILLDQYLDCCFYLGPGKHSKELNRQEATDAVTHNLGSQ